MFFLFYKKKTTLRFFVLTKVETRFPLILPNICFFKSLLKFVTDKFILSATERKGKIVSKESDVQEGGSRKMKRAERSFI